MIDPGRQLQPAQHDDRAAAFGQREFNRNPHPASQPHDRIAYPGIGKAHPLLQLTPDLRADFAREALLVGEMVEEAALRDPGPRDDIVNRNRIDRAFSEQFKANRQHRRTGTRGTRMEDGDGAGHSRLLAYLTE